MISILCVYNNQKVLNDCLIPSLERQDTPYEFIAVDNSEHQYKSAALILNEVGIKAQHDYLMFVHQDVILPSDTWLRDVEKRLKSLEPWGAAGVAGRNRHSIYSHVMHGVPPRFSGGIRPSRATSVQTLDGCLLITPKKVFQKSLFDATTCDGWYLYAAEYCLALNRLGYRIYVIPQEVYHLSPGPSDSRVYHRTLKKIAKKYRSHFKMIYTTIGVWHTPLITLHLIINNLKQIIKRFLQPH